MMGSDEDTSMRLPTFNGQDAKWHMWKSKFLAYTCCKNFQGILNNDEIPRGEKDLKGDKIVLSDADKRHISRSNTVAYASLIMACQSGPFGHINNARSAEFPNAMLKKHGKSSFLRMSQATWRMSLPCPTNGRSAL